MSDMPPHIAIIMDGNGRWARRRLLAKTAGHRAGAQTLRKLAEAANDKGLRYLSVYAFSTENWKRPGREVDGLMNLLRSFIKEYLDDSDSNNIRIRIIGRRDRLAQDLKEQIEYLEDYTSTKLGLTLIIALDYGSRDEIMRAAKRIAQACQDGSLSPDDISEEKFSNYLDTADFPDPALLIRTSGEERLSNFMLWQIAYSELYFCNKLWPDFKIEDLLEAVQDYNSRERRFGGYENN